MPPAGDAENVCLGGGVAWNALLVSALENSGKFKGVFAQPAAGNAGTVITIQEITTKTATETSTASFQASFTDAGILTGKTVRLFTDRLESAQREALEQLTIASERIGCR